MGEEGLGEIPMEGQAPQKAAIPRKGGEEVVGCEYGL